MKRTGRLKKLVLAALCAAVACAALPALSRDSHAAVEGRIDAKPGATITVRKNWGYDGYEPQEENVRLKIGTRLTIRSERDLDESQLSREVTIPMADAATGELKLTYGGRFKAQNTSKCEYYYDATFDVTLRDSDTAGGVHYAKAVKLPDIAISPFTDEEMTNSYFELWTMAELIPDENGGYSQEAASALYDFDTDADPGNNTLIGTNAIKFGNEKRLQILKVWSDGLTPEPVEIEVYRNGQLFRTIRFDENDAIPEWERDWEEFQNFMNGIGVDMSDPIWGKMIMVMDKDPDGKPYVYTVKEQGGAYSVTTESHPNFMGVSSIDALVVTNSPKPETPEQPEKPSTTTPDKKTDSKTVKKTSVRKTSPKTGDAADAGMWAYAALAAAAGLAACGAARADRRRRAD